MNSELRCGAWTVMRGALAFAQIAAVALAAAELPSSRLLRQMYRIEDLSFCNASACVDFDGDGRKKLIFASRQTGEIQMLNAADGARRWSRKLPGKQQTLGAFDLEGKGRFHIVYTVSDPGRLYVIDAAGNVLRQWDSADSKLGNSPVIIDADGDGILDGYLGSRNQSFVRLGLTSEGTYFLPRLVGVGKATELFFTGETIGAAEALSLGIVNRVVPDDKIEEETLVYCHSICPPSKPLIQG